MATTITDTLLGGANALVTLIRYSANGSLLETLGPTLYSNGAFTASLTPNADGGYWQVTIVAGDGTKTTQKWTVPDTASTLSVGSVNGTGTAAPVVLPNVAVTSLRPAPNAIYLMDEGSGSTVFDRSGNGNHATFDTVGPVWTSQGLNFNQYNSCVLIPAAAFTGSKWVMIWYYAQQATQRSSLYMALLTLSATPDANAQNFFLNWEGHQDDGVKMYLNNAQYLTSADKGTGNTSSCFVVGSNPAIYIDGAEVTGYKQKLTSQDTLNVINGPNALLGVAPSKIRGFQGMVYAMVVGGSAVPTAQQISYIDSTIKSLLVSRGVRFRAKSSVTNPLIVFEGDSITGSQGQTALATGYPDYARRRLGLQGFDSFNIGLEGAQFTNSLSTNVAWRVAPYVQKYTGAPKIVHILAGTNDFSGGVTGTALYNAMYPYIAANITNTGALAIIGTVPFSSRTAPWSTYQAQFNSMILSNWVNGNLAPYAASVADYGTSPILSTQTGNPTYSDGTHPTALGNAIMGEICAAAIHMALQPQVPYWIKIPVIWQCVNTVAALSSLVSLYQLGPRWRVLGGQLRITEAWAGTSITTIFGAIGSSNGAASAYLSAVSMTALGVFNFGAPGTEPAENGGVRLTITAAGANLTALTAGQCECWLQIVGTNISV